MRDVLTFVSFMKEIEFVLKLQEDIMTVLCSVFKNPVTTVMVQEDNQGSIELAVSRKCDLVQSTSPSITITSGVSLPMVT